MRNRNRGDNILLYATLPNGTNIEGKSESIEIDTSCSYVPFGFVYITRVKLGPQVTPDAFWSSCIAADSLIDTLTARIEPGTSGPLENILEVIRSDLTRVSGLERANFPTDVVECFTLIDGCRYCCGRVLLLQSQRDCYYIHWHRES